jgi:hypothetical protein
MPTAAAGTLSLALDAFRTTLANCLAFQAWAGVVGAVNAAARIYLVGLPAPADGQQYTLAELASYRPFALASIAPQRGAIAAADATSAGFDFAWGGRIDVQFEQAIAESDLADLAEAERKFLNSLGAILDGLVELAGSGTYLRITGLALAEGPLRERSAERPAQGDSYWALVEVTWSGGM